MNEKHDLEQARILHNQLIIADGHCDVLMALIEQNRRLGEYSTSGHIDLPRLKKAGVKLQFMAAFIESEYKPERALKRVLQLIDLFYTELNANKDELLLIESLKDLEQIGSSNRLSVLLTVEGGEALGEDLAVLRMLYKLGVRSLGLTWNQRNALADGVGESITAGGLTHFGRAVVEEMNQLGMLIDVSHLAEKGFWDVLSLSTHPVMATHSNSAEICPHRRNLTDQQIKALANQGGVIGVTFAPAFIHPTKATITALVKHITHIATLAGIDHVGIGSDFDGIDETVYGLEDTTHLPQLTFELIRSGFSKEDIQKIMGQNIIRVLSRVLKG